LEDLNLKKKELRKNSKGKSRIAIQLKEEEEFEKIEQQLLLQPSKLALAEEKIETIQQIADI
jgi:hypothetical protein